MLTAMTDEPSTRAGFEAGVTDYVTKPFSIPQLPHASAPASPEPGIPVIV